MIKVKNTEQYQSNIVCKGKLVLIKDEIENYSLMLKDGNIYYPIIISEIEQIEVGDKVIDKELLKKNIFSISRVIEKQSDNSVEVLYNDNHREMGYVNEFYKILVLPQHFSPEQLQMIIEGKLQDGDEVMIYCVDDMTTEELVYLIKLNQQKHITIHSINHFKLEGEIIQHKQESWDEIILKLYKDEPMTMISLKIKNWLKENYNPPTRK